ncbi:H+/gluconate symporter-like permease [Paenibacillus sp. OAS669]|nr:H+/gluconate symporter-like permease [Paenibacillus sp. OAS669]
MTWLVEALPFIWIALGVVMMLVLNITFKLNSVLALLIVSVIVGILEGEPLDKLVLSIQKEAPWEAWPSSSASGSLSGS